MDCPCPSHRHGYVINTIRQDPWSVDQTQIVHEMVAPDWRQTKSRHRQETPVIMNTRRDVDRRVDRRIY